MIIITTTTTVVAVIVISINLEYFRLWQIPCMTLDCHRTENKDYHCLNRGCHFASILLSTRDGIYSYLPRSLTVAIC